MVSAAIWLVSFFDIPDDTKQLRDKPGKLTLLFLYKFCSFMALFRRILRDIGIKDPRPPGCEAVALSQSHMQGLELVSGAPYAATILAPSWCWHSANLVPESRKNSLFALSHWLGWKMPSSLPE
ncbi:hypothetical protein BR93DRAFT_763069 [Coniochaeta sp. PMI_546]|nr:hypothetical protein BR93DRAFT_763069 [Coniochaeta sp. PMI_546]